MKLLLLLCTALALLPNKISAQSLTLRGYALDADTRKPLRAVAITLEPLALNTTTLPDGSYRFQLDSLSTDTLTLTATRKGYIDAETRVVIGGRKDIEQDLLLTSSKYQQGEIIVEADRDKAYPIKPTLSFNADELKRIPVLLESDVFRAMQLLPGVSTSNDFSSQVVVRGSDQTQQLTLLDGVPIYNAYHLFGFFSAVNPDVVSNLDLFASAYPVNYGGVASSVFALRTKSDVPERFTASASASLLTTKGSIYTPLGNGMLLLSGRRTYLDLLIALISRGDGISISLNFNDLSGKYLWKVSDEHTLTASAFFMQDNNNLLAWRSDTRFFVGNEPKPFINTAEPISPNWGNFVGSLQWDWRTGAAQAFNLNLYSTSTWVRARRQGFIESAPESADNTTVDNGLIEQGVKAKWDASFGGHQIALGIDAAAQRINHEWSLRLGVLSPINTGAFFDYAPTVYQNQFSRWKAALYASDKISFSPEWSLLAGARAEYFSEQQQVLFSPFARLEFAPDPNKTFYASYGRYYQSLITLAEQLDSFLYSGFKVFFLPERGQVPTADHLIAGVSLPNIMQNFNLTIEGYRVAKQNMPFISFTDSTRRSFSEESVGIDIAARYKQGSLQGGLSYSFGVVTRVQGGAVFPGQFDQRHSLKAFLAYRLFNSLDFAASWILSTGLPYSTPTILESTRQTIYTTYNDARAPLYHRLDVTLTHSFSMWGALAKFFLTVMNAYANNNSFSISFANSWPALPTVVPVFGFGLEF
jgi:hypothetical protein